MNLSPDDFNEENNNSFVCALERDTFNMLGVYDESREHGALCIFPSKVDAEECLVSWGFDSDEWRLFEADTVKEIFFALIAAKKSFGFVCLSPPLNPGKKIKGHDIDSILERMRDYIVNDEQMDNENPLDAGDL